MPDLHGVQMKYINYNMKLLSSKLPLSHTFYADFSQAKKS